MASGSKVNVEPISESLVLTCGRRSAGAPRTPTVWGSGFKANGPEAPGVCGARWGGGEEANIDFSLDSD